jgi:hypothetical protein
LKRTFTIVSIFVVFTAVVADDVATGFCDEPVIAVVADGAVVAPPVVWGVVQPAAHTSTITSAAKRPVYPLMFIVFNVKTAYIFITILIG